MTEITRYGMGMWSSDLKSGGGVLSVGSSLLSDAKLTLASSFEDGSGTNSEEVVGVAFQTTAHAACYSMALANNLSQQGFVPKNVTTRATAVLEGLKITRMHLTSEAAVPGIDEPTFQAIAEETKERCSISALVAPGLQEMTLTATRK